MWVKTCPSRKELNYALLSKQQQANAPGNLKNYISMDQAKKDNIACVNNTKHRI
jgi:hypothetical protein